MTKTFLLISAFLFSFSPRMMRAQEWNLIWSDEFEVEGLPSAEEWNYETGFVRNFERQYYTERRAENARVEDGLLILEARKEKVNNANYIEGDSDWRKSRRDANYTSSSLQTNGIVDWTYGRIEVRAKLPSGKGAWPAIWTLGANIDTVGWPACGEIDIVEFLGKDPTHIHATAHFQRAGKHDSDSKKHPIPDPSKDFHVYSIEWNADQIHFEYDGIRYQTFQVKKADTGDGNPFRKPHFLILNLAIGGSWGGEINDEIFPCQFLVDYVRVYRSSEPSPPKASGQDAAPKP